LGSLIGRGAPWAKGKKLGRARIDRKIEVAIRQALRKGDAGFTRSPQRLALGRAFADPALT
jgi:hypothetical protein